MARANTLEATVSVDPASGAPSGITGRITFHEPTAQEHERHGLISVDEALEWADQALEENGLVVWLAVDRLDLAFSESPELEANALRALFRVYLGFRRLDHIALKLFLRSDIWERITKSGFREASHITRELTIAWNPDSLLQMIVRRLICNDAITRRLGGNTCSSLTKENQTRILYSVCQRRRRARTVHLLDTFEWIVNLISDGSGTAEPRDLIHLFNAAREAQIRRLEMGYDPLPGEPLLDLVAFGEGLGEVSRAHLQQTIYAEHPHYRPWIERLVGERSTYTPANLAVIWSTNEHEAGLRAERLAGIGIFRQAGTRRTPVYRVPLLYRPALGLLHGADWVHRDQWTHAPRA